MKLSGRDSARFCKSPDHKLKGALIHGPDAGSVSLNRRELTKALLGEDADELRITHLTAADVRKDISLLDTEFKARGFFPGRRVVTVDSATDGMTNALGTVLETVELDDAFLILTAGILPARSSLRKLFETGKDLVSLQLFQEAPGQSDIEGLLLEAGLKNGVDPEGMQILMGIAQGTDYGSFVQLVETIALFGIHRDRPLTGGEISAIVPMQQDEEVDRFVDAVAHGDLAAIGPILSRLRTGGTKSVTLLIALQRKFRQIYSVSVSPGGADAAITRIKPPLFGARKTAMQSLVRRWHPNRLEQAIQVLFETDASTRSSGKAPDMAALERCALRLAIMGRGNA